MSKYQVMEILADGKIKTISAFEFKVLPRVGEIISVDETTSIGETSAVYYQVAYVVHGTENSLNAIDILVKRVYDTYSEGGINNFYHELAKADGDKLT
ncbi:MAG: hypothetical protein QNJ53_06025 [Pleurocapsa sp. MO_192.B19]|nr:hypothetical protein [Pleurocapsa sp. MO_192.B19]